jgi:hypothetical protein
MCNYLMVFLFVLVNYLVAQEQVFIKNVLLG